MEDKKYDPILRAAMGKIKKILKEHSIQGSIVLTSDSHCEFGYYFPDWMAAFIDEENNQLRIRSKRKDYNSRSDQEKILTATVGSIAQQRDLAVQNFALFQRTMDICAEHMKIEHIPFQDFNPS